MKALETLNYKKPLLVISTYDNIFNKYYGGGGAIAIHEIAKRLVKDFEVTVITSKTDSPTINLSDGVRYEYIGISKFPRLSQVIFSFLLPFKSKKKQFDIWLESFTPPFTTSLIPWMTNKPVIGVAHTLPGRDLQRKYFLPFKFLENWVLKKYQNIILVSRAFKRELEKINSKANITVINNGVNFPKTYRESEPVGKYILCLSRIEINQKGLDLLLKAYKKLNIKTPKLVIAGPGTKQEKRKLSVLVQSLNLSKKVIILEKVDGLKKVNLFTDCIFVIVPSRFEAFSLTALEAMTYGKAVVSFDIPGLEWIPEGHSIKTKCFDVNLLASNMEFLINKPLVLKDLGSKGKSFSQSFSWENTAEKYITILKNTLNKYYPKDSFIRQIKAIVRQQTPCYFISPHLDDAALSAGGIISNLVKRGIKVSIISVFTRSEKGPLTLSQKSYLKQCGYKDADKLFFDRRAEDAQVCTNSGINYIHLAFTDALWRKKQQISYFKKKLVKIFPSIGYLYPTYKFNIISGRLHTEDNKLLIQLRKELKKIIPPNAVVFSPAGFGKHSDHLLVKYACEEEFKNNLIYWQDFPYAQGEHFTPQPNLGIKSIWPWNLKEKAALVIGYKTQFKGLFPDGKIPMTSEVFYFKRQGEHI